MAAVRWDRPLKIPKEGKLDATKRYRIWAQGATDQVGHRNYLTQLLPHMKACTDPDFELDFKTMTPSVTTVHALSEFRFSRAVIRGAIQAEREDYDVFFMNHFQDVGLYEARAACENTRAWPGRSDLVPCLHHGPQARPDSDQPRLYTDP
jgi:hypothetical protein